MRKELQVMTRDIAQLCTDFYRQNENQDTILGLGINMGLVLPEDKLPIKSDVVMSDDWLMQIASLDRMGDAGLFYLAIKLETVGIITLEDACAWLALEREDDQCGSTKPLFFRQMPALSAPNRLCQLAIERERSNTSKAKTAIRDNKILFLARLAA